MTLPENKRILYEAKRLPDIGSDDQVPGEDNREQTEEKQRAIRGREALQRK